MNEKKEKKAWTTIARECVDKYNETEHTITGFSPKYLIDGTNVTALPEELKRTTDKDEWIRDRRLAYENTIKSHNYNKKLFDKNRKQHTFNVGDTVYIKNGNRLNRKKLDELYIGPLQIVEKISNSIYKVNTGKKKTESTLYHITKLIPTMEEEEETEKKDLNES